MTSEQAKKYLSRIGAEFSGQANAEALSDLQYAHLTSVPYETEDILRGVRINLNIDSLYEKIVENHRGGFCFELNKLFGDLLRTLGYEVTDYIARYLRGETGIPHRRHQVLRVKCADGKEFLCDVGVGALIPLRPVPYDFTAVTAQENGTYSLRRDPRFGVVLIERYGDGWRDVYGFTEDVQLAPDYDYATFWCEFSPDSIFNKRHMLSIRKDGNLRCTLDGNLYRVFSAEGVTEEELSTQKTSEIMAEVFGIRL
ncbi:MAG: arylamine N-acetyltransferase [Clostridia bacterium]|nr:arylamine N-acetyltransferase [Clostridia bacterium]